MNWWTNEFLKVRGGRLYLGPASAESLAARHGTPLFVYSGARLRANYRRIVRAFSAAFDGEVRVAYAMKANSHPGWLRLLAAEGGWIDAVSPGEVAAARRAGIPGRRIIFTGTSLGPEDYRPVFAVPGVTVNIDAVEQIGDMAAVLRALRPGRPVPVSVRWNPGIGRGFNPKVITAGTRSADGTPIKFGVEEDRVIEAFRLAAQAGFRPAGLHQHLGSGWVAADYELVVEAVERMIEMAARVIAAGFPLEFLDFGGGVGTRYARDQRLFPIARYARRIAQGIRRSRLPIRAIQVEPGKALAADAGVLLLKVQYVKTSYGNLFACVNGGTFNTLPRPAIYSPVHHEVVNASRVDGPRAPVTVAGNLCETGDVFSRDEPLAVPRPGDILAVLCAGAYGRSMASEFNLRPIAREILV